MACILAATFCFSGGNAIVRLAADLIPAVEVSFLRSVFALLLQLPLLFWMGSESTTVSTDGNKVPIAKT